MEWSEREKKRRGRGGGGKMGLERGGHEVGFGPFRVNGIRRGRERDICAG